MDAEPTPRPFVVRRLLFVLVTQLDLWGPYDVLARFPETRILLGAADTPPVRTECFMRISRGATSEPANEFETPRGQSPPRVDFGDRWR